MALSELFTGTSEAREHRTDVFDAALESFISDPWPGPWNAQMKVNRTGFKLGLEMLTANGLASAFGVGFMRQDRSVMRYAYEEFKETVVSHGFAHSFLDIPQGAAQLDLIKLRYQALRLAIDAVRERPRKNRMEARAEALQIVEGMNRIVTEFPRLQRHFITRHTKALELAFPNLKEQLRATPPPTPQR